MWDRNSKAHPPVLLQSLLTVEDLTAPTMAVSSRAPQLLNVSVEQAVHTEIVCPVVCCVVVHSWPCPLLSSDALPCTKSLVRDGKKDCGA